MANLLNAVKNIPNQKKNLPFSIYTSVKEQKLLNVPIAKPILIVVLSGNKELGANKEALCHSGDFIFLSNSSAINMRNIPKDKEYFALLIEFDYQDFNGLQTKTPNTRDYLVGKICETLEQSLQQFIEISINSTEQVWSLRKREIILLLCEMGYSEVLSLLANPQIKDRLHEMYLDQGFKELTTEQVCEDLAMSESTLRRKLKLEGASLQQIKDQARLGLALHLMQTTTEPIGVIADKCGYQSQSRFSERFKKRFGLTPSELRQTKLTG